jgi:SpoVK/Ycf46/Vps4 family AAA+-type ATPase
MVHAIARERGWDLVIITPADLAQEGPDRIIARARELLEELSNAERVVVLLDEFEAFVRSRGAKEQEQLWMTMITNSMLPLLQGLRDRGIYCFLATNYVSIIDPAARRPGRFDAVLPIWPPDRAGRRELIAKVRGGAIPNDKLDLAATVTKGCTVKELKTMCDSSDPQWAEGAGASELLEFESELKYARPPVDAKFD